AAGGLCPARRLGGGPGRFHRSGRCQSVPWFGRSAVLWLLRQPEPESLVRFRPGRRRRRRALLLASATFLSTGVVGRFAGRPAPAGFLPCVWRHPHPRGVLRSPLAGLSLAVGRAHVLSGRVADDRAEYRGGRQWGKGGSARVLSRSSEL